MIQAYRIAEKVFIPVMVCLEAFYVSHFMESLELPDQEAVDALLPPLDLPHRFDVDKPGYLVPVVSPELYMDHKEAMFRDMERVKGTAVEVDREFRDRFGRGYGIVESFMGDGAEICSLLPAPSRARPGLSSEGCGKQGTEDRPPEGAPLQAFPLGSTERRGELRR